MEPNYVMVTDQITGHQYPLRQAAALAEPERYKVLPTSAYTLSGELRPHKHRTTVSVEAAKKRAKAEPSA